jgi:hypothetical protein
MWRDDRQHHKTWLSAIHTEAHEMSLGIKEVARVVTMHPHELQHSDALDSSRQPHVLFRAMGRWGLFRGTRGNPRADEQEAHEASKSTGQES